MFVMTIFNHFKARKIIINKLFLKTDIYINLIKNCRELFGIFNNRIAKSQNRKLFQLQNYFPKIRNLYERLCVCYFFDLSITAFIV